MSGQDVPHAERLKIIGAHVKKFGGDEEAAYLAGAQALHDVAALQARVAQLEAALRDISGKVPMSELRSWPLTDETLAALAASPAAEGAQHG